MRICDEANPSKQADFSVIPSSRSRLTLLYMSHNDMNNKV